MTSDDPSRAPPSPPAAADPPTHTPLPSTAVADTDGAAPAHSSPSPAPAPPPTAWQAIYAPQYNTYYFYNTETRETTWNNPLHSEPTPASAPPEEPQTAEPAHPHSSYDALQAAALQAGIDPSLAHLDPSLLATASSSSAYPRAQAQATAPPPTFTAKFNARTGQFTRPDARDPSHLSEHARAARMSEFYFDVKGWEDELAQRGGSLMGPAPGEAEAGTEGRKRKRPSKKDLERFKEQKKQRKITQTAWLRT